jgi:hypothetical protein
MLAISELLRLDSTLGEQRVFPQIWEVGELTIMYQHLVNFGKWAEPRGGSRQI